MDRLLDFYRMQEENGPYLYWVKEVVVAGIILLGFWLFARLLRHLLTTVAPRFTAFTKSDLDDRILERVTPPASLLVIFAGLYYAVSSLPLAKQAHVAASGIIFIITISIVTNIVYRAMDEILEWYAAVLSERHGEGLDRQIIPLLEKLLTIFLVGTALIVTLKHFNYDILSLVTALGIGSLAIGMAAKDTLANMISGFTLMIDRPFRIGDRIQLTSGQWGDVVDIGLRTTKIKTVDNTLLIIPNSELCNSILINQSFPDLRAKGRIDIGISYNSEVDKAKRLLAEIALTFPEVLRDPPPESFFVSFGGSALNLSLFFWVQDYTKVFPTTDKINSLIISRFSEEGIIIPYPTQTVRVERYPEINP